MIEFLMSQANHAHWYVFILFMLAGLNVPISEDLLMIGSSVLAAAVVPDNFYWLLIFAFLGAYLSDLESYWLARKVGARLLRYKFIAKTVNPHRLAVIKRFLEKYGPYTLLVGRFIPFGVRNGMFMTAGLTRMTFWKFALFDFFACVMTTTVLFSLGYSFGKNYEVLLLHINRWKFYIFTAFISALIGAFVTHHLRKRALNNRKKSSPESGNPDVGDMEAPGN